MISMLVERCSYNIIPNWCFYGDIIFALLIMGMLIFIILNLIKCLRDWSVNGGEQWTQT